MHKIKKPIKILALDSGTRYLGADVLRNDELIYWKVITLKNRSTTALLLKEGRKAITGLINDYQPDIVVQEKIFFVQCKCSERLNKLFAEIKRGVKKEKIKYCEYAPTTVRKQICQNGRATKKETAKILVSLYPELDVYLTQDRVWKEKYWGNMFDAVALGLCYWRNGKGRGKR